MNQEISGELENTRCPEIIKILSLGKRTGRLSLSNGADNASIFFQEGKIIHAQCGPLEGEKAVMETAVWTSGEYSFLVDDTPDMITIDSSIEDILTESANRIRQMDRITSVIPSSAAVYALDPDIKDKEITIKSIQWRILVHVDGRKSIAEIAQTIGLGMSDSMKVFYTLIRLGLLKDAETSESTETREVIELPETGFIQAVKKDLTRAMGPIAPFIIAETAQDMGIDMLSDDMNQRASLIETLSSRINDEETSLEFLDSMTDWLNTGRS